jgi:hypothetical protein
MPITHYRIILTKKQPAATARLVAKREPASTISGEQSDRQLSTGASQQIGLKLASSADSDSAQREAVAIRDEMLVGAAKEVSGGADGQQRSRIVTVVRFWISSAPRGPTSRSDWRCGTREGSICRCR